MTSIFNSLLAIVLAQLLVCGWIGHAAIFIYRRKLSVNWISISRLNLIHLVFSPVAGLLVLFLIAELTLPFPQGKMGVLIGLLVFSTFENIRWIRKQQFTWSSSFRIFYLLVAAILIMAYNGQDLVGVNGHDYFPRTNGDTFSYISHIDQFRYRSFDFLNPLSQNSLIYPASFRGYYGPVERNGVSALGAFFANALNLETHVAFFSILRLTLICIVLGLVSILLIIKLPAWITVFCSLVYIFGCFYLHTVLQQFLSATAGVLAVMGAIFCTCLWIGSGYRRHEAFLSGAALGLLLCYSPETAPTLFLASILFLFITLADQRAREKLKDNYFSLMYICVGLVATSLPLLFEPLILISTRMRSLQEFHSTPYEVEEIIGFGLHLVGLRSGLGWSGISALEKIVLCISVSAIVIGSCLLMMRAVTRVISQSHSWNERIQVVTYLSILSGTYVVLQIVFASQRLSYPWVKTMDYFNFLPCLVLALCADWMAGDRSGWRKSLTIFGVFLFCALFIRVAIPAKDRIFSFYKSNTIDNPPLDVFLYRESNDIAITGISPSLRGFSLELFYYMNRWRKVPLEVHMADKAGGWASYRYLQESSQIPNVSHHFCLDQKWNVSEIQQHCENSAASSVKIK